MTPIQTRWLQHLAATSRIPPHELARRLRQPLEVLAGIWRISVADLKPPRPPEPGPAAPLARQIAAPESVPHLTVGDFSHEAHAGIPVDGSSGPVIPAAPKPKSRPKPTEAIENWDTADTAPKTESIAETYERLRAVQEASPLPPPSPPRKIL